MLSQGRLSFASFGAIAALSAALSGCLSGVVWYGKTPDRSRPVSVLQDIRGQRVRVGDEDHTVYQGIGVESIAWSRDSKHFAYAARTLAGWVIVRDGVEGRVVDGVGQTLWSPDGKHLAVAVEQRGRWLVYRDDSEEPSVEAIRARSMRFSEDGNHFAFVGEEARKVIAVIDGARSNPYDAIGHLLLGKMGRPAFVARRGEEALVVSGGKESEPYEDVADLTYSPGGQSIAWTARRKGAWWVFSGRSEIGPFDRVSSLVWSPAGEHLAFSVGSRLGEWVVHDERRGKLFEGVLPGSVRFDATGTHIVYAARSMGAWRAVVDDVEGPPYGDMEAPVFVGKSTAVAHLARRGEATFLTVDGNLGPVEADASGLVLSPDGERFLYTARFGVSVRVVEGRIEGAPCGEGRCRPVVTRVTTHDTVVAGSLVWSESGRRSGYLAGERTGRRLYLIVNGARGPELDLGELMAGVTVNPDLAGALSGDSPMLAEMVRAELTLAEKKESASPADASKGGSAGAGASARASDGAGAKER